MESPLKKTKIGPGRPKISDSDKKKNQRARNRLKNKASVYLGSEIKRWMLIKEELGLSTHPEVAKMLIDTFLKSYVNKKDTQRLSETEEPSFSSSSFGLHQCLNKNTDEVSESESGQSSDKEGGQIRIKTEIVIKTEVDDGSW